jgi:tetratricopeptide (TPR) repeat protein
LAWFVLGLFAMDAPLDMMPKATAAADRALEIDDRDGEAWAVAAGTRAMEWDWSGAESLFRKSLHVLPGSDLSRHMCALTVLLPMVRIEEALAMLDEAQRIDPLSPLAAANKAAALIMARRPADAECHRALELDPHFWRVVVSLGRCHETFGRYDEAIGCFEQAVDLSEGVPSAIGALGRAYALAGRTADAHRLLGELEDLSRSRYVSPYGRVLIFLGLSDDRVFDWLERSCTERVSWLMFLATDPRFDPVRDDVRFRSCLNRLGLPLIAYPDRGSA